jgi:hypothetical protein
MVILIYFARHLASIGAIRAASLCWYQTPDFLNRIFCTLSLRSFFYRPKEEAQLSAQAMIECLSPKIVENTCKKMVRAALAPERAPFPDLETAFSLIDQICSLSNGLKDSPRVFEEGDTHVVVMDALQQAMTRSNYQISMINVGTCTLK